MSIRKKKVLVVDDDPDILAFIQAMLEDEGYKVATTERSDRLKELTEGDVPNVIVLDMLLSGNDGRDITIQLKSQENTKHIPIILLSAHPEAEREAKRVGADAFLAKPFEMDELLALVAWYA